MVEGGAGLRPPCEATTVRVRDDEVLLTDGPFAETKEQIGGFVLIDCADLDEAIEIAAEHPAARLRHDRDPAGAGAAAGTSVRRCRSEVFRRRSGARSSPP